MLENLPQFFLLETISNCDLAEKLMSLYILLLGLITVVTNPIIAIH